ncbi:apolipoprotein L3-like [Callorhinchus milii]|uniref:Apolipoprotein L, 1 n=1 Tax=Callorhinchus milii TaxID=7868 RepID=K4FYJ6_CALMI|nr:apolipoprotein L3-like [Callorhinchus milii]AFK11377.1 apolipoprotein L, 1 [Callorhinchus milii]
MAGILKPDADLDGMYWDSYELDNKAEDLQSFPKKFPDWKARMNQHVILLQEIANNIDECHKGATIANITGSSVGVLGGALTIGGLIAAPFTLGTSLILTGVGVGVGVAGGLTNITASAVDSASQSNKQKRVNEIMEKYKKDSEEMADCFNKFRNAVDFYENCSDKLEKEAFIGVAEVFAKSLGVFPAVASAVTKQSLRTFKAVSGVLSGLFVAWDIYSITVDSIDLSKGAETEMAKQIRDVARKIKDEVMKYEEVYEALSQTVKQI